MKKKMTVDKLFDLLVYLGLAGCIAMIVYGIYTDCYDTQNYVECIRE